MQNQFTRSDLSACLEQLKSGQTQVIPLHPHPLLIAYLLHHLENAGPHILISAQKQLLSQIHQALTFFEPEQKVFHFEERIFSEQKQLNISHQFEHKRLQFMIQAQKAVNTDIFTTSAPSLMQRAVPPDLLKKNFVYLKKGEKLAPDFPAILINLGYLSRDRVEQIGEFSMRGSVMDIFSPLHGPLRTELIGDEIAQIKTFNIKSQISETEIKEVQIPPTKEWSMYNRKETYQKIKKIISTRTTEENILPSFSKWNQFLLQGASALYLNENVDNILPSFQSNSLSLSQKKPQRQKKIKNYDFLMNWEAAFIHQSQSIILDHFSFPLIWSLDGVSISAPNPSLKKIKENLEENKKDSCPSFQDIYLPIGKNKKIREIIFNPLACPTRKKSDGLVLKNFFKNPHWTTQIKKQKEKGLFVFISAGKEYTRKQITTKLENLGMTVKEEGAWSEMRQTQQLEPHTIHLVKNLNCDSLIWPEENLLFLRADSFLPPSKPKNPLPQEDIQGLSFNFSELQSGNLVIHKQYGIGCFQKLEVVDFGTGENEFLVLEYKDKDLLYIPVYAFHLIQKYSSPSIGNKVLLDKLGDKRWLRTKEKVRKRIREMTMGLMNLYSLRSSLKRKRFSSSGENFEQFTKDFPFTETPDQKKAIEDILKDLTKKEQPTDRLICGDTGFGKTEVALRAAFTVVEDNFQVCLMAPTTILSFQHFERFKERLKNWPITIRLLNRFTSLQERRQILKETEEGTVDILIGTHRILSRDIHFKKLGLLIIDEEHLFGVKSKEKIKNWYSHVDTISLSATPIPRSLSMSLGGLRDISVIFTPPPNRKAVETFISPFNEGLIKKAILKELDRKGQIIFIHNRINDIHKVEEKLKTLLPSVKIQTAHGKMKNLQQKVVLDFFYKKFDLLLCTTIVESGMDFPQANTLFINRADQFGLSQLHQLRGRVGRSERQSYCYLLIDPLKPLFPSAMERLKIIQENNQPGAGIRIAQYDLEMRGAGELMGAEQSGFLHDIGYEMYFELLRENINSLKTNEVTPAPEPDLKFKQAAFFPHKYIPHEKIRLMFYKKLSMAESEKEVEKIRTELRDFAGPLPEEAKNLILLGHCRWLAKKWHIRELFHQPPWLYVGLADSTPIPIPRILQWIENKLCKWHDKSTLKFLLEENSLHSILTLLKKIR